MDKVEWHTEIEIDSHGQGVDVTIVALSGYGHSVAVKLETSVGGMHMSVDPEDARRIGLAMIEAANKLKTAE